MFWSTNYSFMYFTLKIQIASRRHRNTLNAKQCILGSVVHVVENYFPNILYPNRPLGCLH